MDPRHRRALLFCLLGVALLANPLYLYPENVSYETTYTYEATETDRIPHHADIDTEIERCSLIGVGSDTCVVARDMASGEPVEVPLEDSEETAENLRDDLFWEYDFVSVGSSYYEPNVTVANRAVRLSLDPVAEQTVRETAAEPLDETPRYVRWAVENGTVNVTEEQVPYEARYFYVEHENTYYLVEPVRSERVPTGWGWREPSDVAVDAMRLVGWIGGVALIWRAGEWSERGRRAQERREREATRDERLR